jgi:outer membrane protein TolC
MGQALRLAGVDNPTINLARERIQESLALQLGARALLLPNINAGANYHYNNGPVEASFGQIIPVADQVLYAGFGSGAVGASAVTVPGLWLFSSLSDAIYEPKAVREVVAERRSESAAINNAILRDVAVAYLRLVGSEARLDVLRGVDREGAEMVQLTLEFSQAGQGRPADADRARAYNRLVERERQAALEEVAVASAQLCRLLSLDPSIQLRTPSPTIEPIRLISEDDDPETLIALALQARPELSGRSAAIREAQVRLRHEKVRPLLPTVSVGVSSATFSGASDLITSRFEPFTGRTDIDAMAVWNLQNLGFGNRARVREATAILSQALAEYGAVKNRIRSEVLDALAEARAAAAQLDIARAAVANANEGYQLDLQRIKGGKGVGPNAARPIELLDSFNNILQAREELVAAVIGYDIAQFRLFVAVGSNPLNGPNVSPVVPPAVMTGAPGCTPPAARPKPILPPWQEGR